jgi:tetratricopeptide (TPR) repeat protein
MLSVLILVLISAPVLAQTKFLDNPTKQVAPAPAESLSAEQQGDILMARKMFREAVEAYREGPASSAVLHNKIGIAFHQMIQFEPAKKEYEQAIKLNPAYSEAINNLGAIFYGTKNYRRAIRQYLRALTIAPNAASIYSNLGSAYFARKDYPKAVQAYQKALDLDPEVFEHHNQYGTLLQERPRAVIHPKGARRGLHRPQEIHGRDRIYQPEGIARVQTADDPGTACSIGAFSWPRRC